MLRTRREGRWTWLVPPPGPVRTLATIALVKRTGSGAFFTLIALYLLRFADLAAVSVGICLSVAGVAGLLAGIPSGHLADRFGPRPVLVSTLALTGLGAALTVTTTAWAGLLVAISITMIGDCAGIAAGDATIGALVADKERSTARAYTRIAGNIGLSLGTAVAAVPLVLDTHASYVAALALNAIAFLVAAGLATRLPRTARVAREEAVHVLTAVRDVRFVAVTGVCAVLGLHYWIVEIAMPLWLVTHTRAPHWLVSVLLIGNTVVVVLGQVRVARRVQTRRSAIHAAAVSGVLLVVACGLFGASGAAGVIGSTLLLAAAASLHVAAELGEASATAVVGYDLAPDYATGQYLGLFGMTQPIGEAIGPMVMTALPLTLGVTGWWLLGGLLLAAGLAFGPLVRWCAANRGSVLIAVPAAEQIPAAA